MSGQNYWVFALLIVTNISAAAEVGESQVGEGGKLWHQAVLWVNEYSRLSSRLHAKIAKAAISKSYICPCLK